jgi:hypothetical protein
MGIEPTTSLALTNHTFPGEERPDSNRGKRALYH